MFGAELELGQQALHPVEETEWVPGIFDLCHAARLAGYACIVVTNQAGIARGYYSEAEFIAYTQWMHAQFALRGTPLLATYFCPHHPTAGIGAYKVACDCRKPGPGMLEAARRQFEIEMSRSVLVGDKPSDMRAGQAAHVGNLFLLEAGEPPPRAPPEAPEGIVRCSSLAVVRRHFLGNGQRAY